MDSSTKPLKRLNLSSLNMHQSNLQENRDLPNCPSCCNVLKSVELKITELNNSINELKGTVKLQNEAIMTALGTQKAITQNLVKQDRNDQSTRNYFPIKTATDLSVLNDFIDDENRLAFVNTMKSLLKGKLQKTLSQILSTDVIVDFNIDGTHGKRRLKDFRNVFETLMDALRSQSTDPDKELRGAFHVIKKRHFHNVCLQNQNKI